MDQRLDFLFYNKARERFYNWADARLDLESLIRFHAIYADPFVSRAALTRIIRVWAAGESYKVFVHTSILDFSDERNQSEKKNIIHLVWIPAEGWKYFNSVRDFAVEKFPCSKIIFLPDCDKMYQKKYVKDIKQGVFVFTYYPNIVKLQENHKKIFMEDKIRDRLLAEVKDVYNHDIRVILITVVYEDSLPNDCTKYITRLKDDLRKDRIRTTVKFLRIGEDLNLLDLEYLQSPRKKLFIICGITPTIMLSPLNTVRLLLDDLHISYAETRLNDYFND